LQTDNASILFGLDPKLTPPFRLRQRQQQQQQQIALKERKNAYHCKR
jgi:hypothetical protein